jgi:biotin operon repressor
MSTANLVVEDLVAAYGRNESASSLARQHGVSVWSIIKRLRNAGVEIRTNQNERRLATSPGQENLLGEVVDGLLLGDGSIDPKGCLRLEQCHAHAGWIHHTQQLLEQLGAESKVIPIAPKTKTIEGREVQSSGGLLLYTPCYVRMKTQRARWYPEGVKIVPSDLRLASMSVAQWLCGDGTYDEHGALFFCTNNFTESEVGFLVQRLQEDLDVEARVKGTPRTDQFTLAVYQRDEAVKVANMVRDLLPECFRYKLQHVREAIPRGAHMRKVTDAQVQEIRLRAKTERQAALAGECRGVPLRTL